MRVCVLHSIALQAITAYEAANTSLWISRQILREYLAVLNRPSSGIPINDLTSAVRAFEARYRIAEESPLVTAQLLTLLEQSGSRQVHDTNIVATMLASGIPNLLTNNPADFSPYAYLITIIPLV